MCYACILIDQSLPSAKSLAKSLIESGIPESHMDSILDRITDNLPEKDVNDYLDELKSEFYLEHVRRI